MYVKVLSRKSMCVCDVCKQNYCYHSQDLRRFLFDLKSCKKSDASTVLSAV